MATRPLKHFAPEEFKHWELVDQDAADFLDAVRSVYGQPLVLTSDARTVEENAAASGSSPTSLHLFGRAFDLRWIPDDAALWRFVVAVMHVGAARSLELELVNSDRDKHIHLGLFTDGRPSRLEVRAD